MSTAHSFRLLSPAEYPKPWEFNMTYIVPGDHRGQEVHAILVFLMISCTVFFMVYFYLAFNSFPSLSSLYHTSFSPHSSLFLCQVNLAVAFYSFCSILSWRWEILTPEGEANNSEPSIVYFVSHFLTLTNIKNILLNLGDSSFKMLYLYPFLINDFFTDQDITVHIRDTVVWLFQNILQ